MGFRGSDLRVRDLGAKHGHIELLFGNLILGIQLLITCGIGMCFF